MRRVDFAPDFAAWRDAARRLLGAGLPPDAVHWAPTTGEHQGRLFAAEASTEAPEPAAGRRPPTVPKAFLELAREVADHRDPERWDLLYRLLWRLATGARHLLQVDVDPAVQRLRTMQKAVRRDAHKMKAFVRFRRLPGDDGEPWFVAWHRPDHHIVRRVAPFFVERFNDQRWLILTPDAAASWDRRELRFGPGAPRHEAPAADALEDLWRTYYRSIFNPARLKVKAMTAEMPVRHWATLPEAELIPDLVRSARTPTAGLLAAPSAPPTESFLPSERDLASLAAAVADCRACGLCTAGRAVWGEGPADARLVLVGEQPGDREERVGRPFVGPAGRVLDQALDAAGVDRGSVYLTNVVKHFRHEVRPGPRGSLRIHRTPGQTEVSACLPWLEAELEQIRPRLLVCLGATAARALVGAEVRLRRDRGRPRATAAAPWTLVTYHPSAVLRSSGDARDAIAEHLRADLALAAAELRRLGP